MSKEKDFSLEEIWDGLSRHRGAKDEVARRANCKREWVRQVLTGKFPDPDLVIVAAQVWAEHEQQIATKKQTALSFVMQAREAQNALAV
jgi:hypothetical protein